MRRSTVWLSYKLTPGAEHRAAPSVHSAHNIRHANPNVFIMTSATQNSFGGDHHGVTVTLIRTVRVAALPTLVSPVYA